MDEELMEAARLRAKIEAEPFPRNLAAFIDEAAAEMGDAPAANFFDAGVVLSDAATAPFGGKQHGAAVGVQAETWW